MCVLSDKSAIVDNYHKYNVCVSAIKVVGKIDNFAVVDVA